MKAIALGVVLFGASVAWGEAGIPLTLCGAASCACGPVNCTCGQVCNGSSNTCESSQSAFCSSDSQCAVACDSFICQFNVCVRGVRTDGGTGGGSAQGGGGAGGGASAAGGGSGSTGGGSGVDAGSPDGGTAMMQTLGCGCSQPSAGWLVVLGLVTLVRRRR